MDKAAQDPNGEAHYLDYMQNEQVYLGSYTLKQCREMEICLGLDLKGGLNVILEVSVPDVVKALADMNIPLSSIGCMKLDAGLNTLR